MEKKHMFSNRDLRKLLIPVVIEQLLNSLMGMVDSVMVSNVGAAAISAVSLVDSINVLVIQAFYALAAGGAILCSQYIGQGNMKKAAESAKQLFLLITIISTVIMAAGIFWRFPLLSMIFGRVDQEVMSAAQTYFFYTALSFPFIGLYNAGSSVYRAQGNTRLPMTIAVASNGLNIVGNFILIWGFGMGVKGAAISTLVSRIFSAVTVIIALRKKDQILVVRDYLKIRPQSGLMKSILSVGIPNGIENSMFQFGKLAIQSTVSTMGTIAIAAQAMTNILENLNGIAGLGIGIGMMTVVGQCMGAGEKEEAAYYIKKLTGWGEIAIVVSCAVIYLLTGPITRLAGMEPESAELCLYMVGWITVIKPLAWTLSFVPAYGMRAAGDVKFSMAVSCTTMWLCRVSLCIFLCRQFGMGPMAVWIGMFSDWILRSIIYTWRFFSKRWMRHKLV